MAALTRSGARNAREIVMLTLRGQRPLRFAMVSAGAVTSVASSSRHRLTQVFDATNVARVFRAS